MDKVKELKYIIKDKEVGEISKTKKEVMELEESFDHSIFRKRFQKSRSQSH